MLRSGSTTPTVIVLPGMGHTTLEWMRVQQALAEMTDATVFVVDRVGWSDPAPWPRTPHAIARELHATITALGITDPVILVGHSLGGLAARLFTARHPDLVASLILVDSSHEDQLARMGTVEWSNSAAGYCVRAARLQSRMLGLTGCALFSVGAPRVGTHSGRSRRTTSTRTSPWF